MKKLIFAIVVLASFSHCTKFGKNISVEGRLVNHLTGEGLSGVEMRIVRNSSTTYEGGGKEVKSTTTDENGHFRMDRLGVIETHSVQIKSLIETYDLGWYSESGELLTKSGLLTLKKGKTTRANYHVVPYGKLKIALNAVNCEGPSDVIVYERNYLTDPSYSGFIPLTFTGCYNNPGAFAKVPAGYYQIKLKIIRSGVTTFYEEQIFVPGNGEFETIINY